MFPTKDVKGNPMTPDYGYCEYKNVQKVIIQEMPENAPTGQMPRSIMVMLDGDIVDKVKPGDRVEVTGIFKTIANMGSKTSGIFKTILMATGISTLNEIQNQQVIDANDIRNFKKVSRRSDIFELFSQSIAPSIHGHAHIKKSILLLLIGGQEKNLENKTHLRGDINILFVGDPSTAKSQMLRHVLNMAPLCINTTGRGASGVGLTAAVLKDKETGEIHLEAGAMVLGDRGIVCIDEFDKMGDDDRVAIHEVMEQQTVTISKAGIHTTLNARCSVIAAANPIYGDYDRTISASKNIGMADSLLSRFDLLFIILDEKNAKHDSRIAKRVILNHTYRDKNSLTDYAKFGNEDTIIEPELKDNEESKGKKSIFDQHKKFKLDTDHEMLTLEFIKKYIQYAKTKSPILNEDACDFLSEAYSSLRQKGEDKKEIRKTPITVRTLETLIRLSTAHAKLRLSDIVDIEDMKVALSLVNFATFEEDDNDMAENSS